MPKTEILKIDEKYTIINGLSNGGGFKALRYGNEWRNLAGDNLVLSMFYRIQEQEEELEKLRDKLNPHRSCPDCGEDCMGWVSHGERCRSR